MKNRTPVPSDQRPPVPPFTPVARRYRHDGWTPARQRAFVQALAETGSVTHAAQRINMAKEGAYQLRLAPDAESFRVAWAAALDYGVQCLADLAIDRARDGVAVPIFHNGAQVGEKRAYDNRLLQFVLRHHMPDRYGAQIGGGTCSRATIEREAAENCPTCRAAREKRAGETSGQATAAWLDKLLHRYLLKIRQEQEERRAGRWYAADFYLRQLTHLELILDMGGRSDQMIARFAGSPEEMGQLNATPVSDLLARRRAAYWATSDGLPRPPVRRSSTVIGSAMMNGQTMDHRYVVRAECERRIAAAQDEWEATRTEESWKEWCDRWL